MLGRSRRGITPSDEGRLVERRIVYGGRIIELALETYERQDGSRFDRETVLHPGAAAVLPILESGEILLVSQHRHAVRQALWEIPAGKLDPGESPLGCAKRELREETGHVAEHWVELMSFFTTPGFSNECITLFRAEGLAVRSRLDDGEITALRSASPETVWEMIASGAIVDAKTILAVAWLRAATR